MKFVLEKNGKNTEKIYPDPISHEVMDTRWKASDLPFANTVLPKLPKYYISNAQIILI